MKITKKELFKFCDENNDAINELQSQSDNTDFLLAVLIQQLKDSGVIDEISPELKPQLKQLDQSVFDGLDEKWRFAAVDKCGEVWYSTHKTQPSVSGTHLSPEPNADSMQAKGYYDASNWQNSLIERDITKELLEIDLSSELTGSELCKAMLARGDKYVMCLVGTHNDAVVIEGMHGNEFVAVGMRNLYRNPKPINNQGEPLTSSEVGL